MRQIKPEPPNAGPSVQSVIAPKPVNAANAEQLAALQLLKIEGEIRDAASHHELMAAVTNLSRGLMRARQILVAVPAGDSFKVQAVSGLAIVERTAPVVSWLERILDRAQKDTGLAEPRQFRLEAYSDPGSQSATFPFQEAQWVPVRARDGKLLAGLLMLREGPWLESDLVVGKRLAATTAHAWHALNGVAWQLPRMSRNRIAVATVVVACIGFFPVSMSTLAPLEIAAKEPFIVTASLDGVVEAVVVSPNVEVRDGQTLVRFVDTTLRSRLAVAEREAIVAEARLKKLSLQSFTEMRGRHDMAIARAELAVKLTEREYAREQLGRSQIKAQRSGLAVFGDVRDLIGRPMATGEKLMEIADPARIEIRVDVPVSDSIILAPGARVTAYLDSDPLRPLAATVVRADYQARPRDNGMMAFRVVAELNDTTIAPPRLGIRGTAQLFGNSVSLGFYLFRRPIAAVRQLTGI